jgi:hypothetical protein
MYKHIIKIIKIIVKLYFVNNCFRILIFIVIKVLEVISQYFPNQIFQIYNKNLKTFKFHC